MGKNPREGRSLGDKPDGKLPFKYPVQYPKGADDSIIRSIVGKSENEKTFKEMHMDREDDEMRAPTPARETEDFQHEAEECPDKEED